MTPREFEVLENSKELCNAYIPSETNLKGFTRHFPLDNLKALYNAYIPLAIRNSKAPYNVHIPLEITHFFGDGASGCFDCGKTVRASL